MCLDCGCGDVNIVPVDVEKRILARNDSVASHNREELREHGVFAINLMGSPGSGKTAVLEATGHAFHERRLAALAGDLATDHDAARLQRAGIDSRAITTGQACHLDAEIVHHELHHLDLKEIEYLFIENVGNLVCPAVYDLGQAANVVVLSVTEGEDKPLKYPTMFAKADLVLVTKIDLLPFLGDIDVREIEDSLRRVMPDPQIIFMSAPEGMGVDSWLAWLTKARDSMLTSAEVMA